MPLNGNTLGVVANDTRTRVAVRLDGQDEKRRYIL
jgi:hypothetical protein